uniref:Uncharacterized protein n=1 Tax=Arundo donax TaxID=35708 RepID=A0A0A9G0U1_ARUDO
MPCCNVFGHLSFVQGLVKWNISKFQYICAAVVMNRSHLIVPVSTFSQNYNMHCCCCLSRETSAMLITRYFTSVAFSY